MPARLRIVVLTAILALAVPSAALAQSGGGGAGDSQYQDPFGSQTQSSKPSKPAQQQPAQQQSAPPAAAAPSAQTQAQQSQAQQSQPSQSAPAQTLPRTGFDVVPVAVAGLLLLLGGLALWRRPHADR
jgi:LPXTG-motif cell wall-anchored protein